MPLRLRARGLLVPVLVVLGTLAARGTSVRMGEHPVLVRVVDARDGRALQNAEVADRDRGVRRMTDAHGEATLSLGDLPSHLRLRQLGFRFADTVIAWSGRAGVDTVQVALARAAVTLPPTMARGASSCSSAVDPVSAALSLEALGQLRFAAEQYDRFREEYPFTLQLARRTVIIDKSRKTGQIKDDDRTLDAKEWGERYQPGEVLHEQRGRFGVSILFLSNLADTVFWSQHCLVARSVETRGGLRMLPLDFAPVAGLRSPDWSGTAWLDSATSQLHRIDFELSGLDNRHALRRLQGYMTFTHPSPFVARPDSIVAGWWRSAPADSTSWGTPDEVQLLRVKGVAYQGRTPNPDR